MKGQVAVETLLIYGLAILITMLGVAALISFGVLDLGGLLPERCEVTGVAIECSDYLVDGTNDDVKIQLLNSMGKNIAIKNVSIEGEGDNLGLWDGGEDTCRFDADASSEPEANQKTDTDLSDDDAVLVLNGERETFTLKNCDISVDPGSRIQGRLTVTYATVGSEIIKNAYGEMNVPVS